jgi:hypothetical protein
MGTIVTPCLFYTSKSKKLQANKAVMKTAKKAGK